MSKDTNSEEKFKKLCELTKGDYRAFLYDCDGTLANNMEDHKETYVRVAAERGVKIDPQIVDELAGFPTAEVVKEINKRYNCQLDPAEFDKAKSELFRNEYVPKTKPMGFVVEHLKASAGTHKIAVVSGSGKQTIQKTLELLGIDSLVQVMVADGDYEKGKPHPDPFLMGAKKLGVEPEKCIVFEDGDPGVQAAKAAGMKSIRVDQI